MEYSVASASIPDQKWPKLSLREAGVELIDCDHRTPAVCEAGFPYVAIPQLKDGHINLADARLISAADFTDWTRKAKPQAHDVVLSRRCNPGETAYVPEGKTFAVGQNLVLLRSNGTKLYPPFLRWLVRGPEWWDQIEKYLNYGAVFDSLKCADVPHFTLTIPPLGEQRRIAHILGTLDDTIELNRRMNATLEAMARALFRSWFVDFDPVRAKAEGREPVGMDAATAALFPDEFEESELGEIPKGWEVKTIDELAEINSWSLTNSYTIDPIDYIEISEVSKGEIYTIQRYPRGKEPSRARRRLRHGDTVLSTVRPDRASYFLCFKPDPSLIASTGFAVVTPTIAPWSFVYVALTRPEIFEYLGQVADGGAYPAIRSDVIGAIETVWPNVSELVAKYHRISEVWLAMAERNKQQSRVLASLRDILLPELLSGCLKTINCGCEK